MEKVIEVSNENFDINPLYCVGLPSFTLQFALKQSGNNLQTLQDKEFTLFLEKKIRGGISSVLDDRYITADERKSCK